MNLNLIQTKLIGLTMELDLKTREYKVLCTKLEKIKENQIDENDKRLIGLRDEFQKNQEEIIKIKEQIKEIKMMQEKEEQEIKERYNSNNLFKKSDDKMVPKEKEKELEVIKEDNLLKKLLKKIRKYRQDNR